MKFERKWAMPSADTFSIKPIGEFVKRYMTNRRISVDPFARNCNWARCTNDLNAETLAQRFLRDFTFADRQGIVDLLLFDPPYSPRQISECYKSVGREVGIKGTQNAALYKRCRDAAIPILAANAVVLSFGWNSTGMGKERGFEIIEILLVCHGGGHNDTICLAERKCSTLL